jgi:hypothetical protein
MCKFVHYPCAGNRDLMISRLENDDRFGPYVVIHLEGDYVIDAGLSAEEAVDLMVLWLRKTAPEARRIVREAELWAKMSHAIKSRLRPAVPDSCVDSGACGQ